MTASDDETGTVLAEYIRAVDGVAALYSPSARLTPLPGAFAPDRGSSEVAGTVVITSDADDVPTVSARIAALAELSVAHTARRVADTILARTPRGTRVFVEVARIC